MKKGAAGAEYLVCERGPLNAKGDPPFADSRPYPDFDAANGRAWEIDPTGEQRLYIWRRN